MADIDIEGDVNETKFQNKSDKAAPSGVPSSSSSSSSVLTPNPSAPGGVPVGSSSSSSSASSSIGSSTLSSVSPVTAAVLNPLLSSSSTLRLKRNWLIHLHYVRQEFDECLKVIDIQLNECKGQCEYAIYVKALIRRQQGSINESLQLFQAATVLNPHNVSNLKQVGRSLYLLGKHKQALDVYEESLRIGVEDWEVWHNKGLCHMYLKSYDKSIECFLHANSIQRHDSSYMQLGKVYALMEEYEKAIEIYLEALDFSPENPEILTTVGLLYLRLGQNYRAFDFLGNSLTHDPKNAKTILAAGSIIQDHNDMDVALVKYRIAAVQTPNSAQLWNNIGMCFLNDTRILTNFGFLDRKQIQKKMNDERRKNQNLLLFACYDKKTASIMYRPGKLVFPKNTPKYLVDFTEKKLSSNCLHTSKSTYSNRLSLRVTPEHQMFVQLGERYGDTVNFAKNENGKEIPFRKVRAAQLTPSQQSTGREVIRMLGAAVNGVFVESSSPSSNGLFVGCPCLTGLSEFLNCKEKQLAFLSLYGYWLATGNLSYERKCQSGKSIGVDAVCFTAKKSKDVQFLDSAIQRMGMASNEYSRDVDANGNMNFQIIHPLWFRVFEAEYWCKYEESSARRSTAEHVLRLQELKERGLDLCDVKSAKWFWSWCFELLNKDEIRTVLGGLQQAEEDDETVEIEKAGSMFISTASIFFRDELLRACLHAGYSVDFEPGNSDNWNVFYSDINTTRMMDLSDVKFDGRGRTPSPAVPFDARRDGRPWCVSVSHEDHLIFAQRFVRSEDGKITQASTPLWVSNCFFGKGRFVAAIACLKRALYLDPFEWIISYNLGLVHLNTEQYASAFHYLSASINLKPDFPSSYMYLGITLNRLDDFENACSAYEKALAMENDHLFELNYAITLWNHGHTDNAKIHFNNFQKLWNELEEEVKSADPDVVEAMNAMHAAIEGGGGTNIPTVTATTTAPSEANTASLAKTAEIGKSSAPSAAQVQS